MKLGCKRSLLKSEERERVRALLKDRFDLDETARLMTIHLRFDRFEDVFTTQGCREGGAPMVRQEALETISSLAKHRPFGYRLKFDIAVSDLQGHTGEECEKLFVDSLFLAEHISVRHTKVENIVALALLVFGILILIFNALCNGLEWLSTDSVTWSTISEVLDIAAWVFVWEAVTIYFIERPESKAFQRRFRRTLAEVCFRQAEEDSHEEQTAAR